GAGQRAAPGGVGSECEAQDAGGAEGEAVDGEGGEGAGLEVADEEADRQVGGDGGDHHAEQDVAVDVCAGGTGQGGELEDAGREDGRGGQEEGEPGGVFV